MITCAGVLGYCLVARQVTFDVQVSVSVDQEFAVMSLRLHKKKRLAEILWEGADVLLTALHHPALLLSMNLGKAPASTSSSRAGLCKRGRPGRLKSV